MDAKIEQTNASQSPQFSGEGTISGPVGRSGKSKTPLVIVVFVVLLAVTVLLLLA